MRSRIERRTRTIAFVGRNSSRIDTMNPVEEPNVVRASDLQELAKGIERLITTLEQCDKPAPELTDAAGVAHILGLGERTVRRLDSTGRLPFGVMIGGAKRWSISELREWIMAGAPSRIRWAAMKDGI